MESVVCAFVVVTVGITVSVAVLICSDGRVSVAVGLLSPQAASPILNIKTSPLILTHLAQDKLLSLFLPIILRTIPFVSSLYISIASVKAYICQFLIKILYICQTSYTYINALEKALAMPIRRNARLISQPSKLTSKKRRC